MQEIWNSVFYQPIYNALVFIIENITFGDVGFAIILLTIIVKLILFPLTKKSIKSQILMKRIEPELKRLKKEYPNKEDQAKKTIELYKKHKANPFSGCLVVILQLPVILALYYVFYKDLSINLDLLYPFINTSKEFHTNFLGFIEMGNKSALLAILAGVTQFIQGYLSTPLKSTKDKETKEASKNEKKTFQEELANSMQMNVKYILPVFITFIAWKISAAVALYWITSNIFTIVQEWYIRRQLKENNPQ